MMVRWHSGEICTEPEAHMRGRPVKTKFLHQELPLAFWSLSDIDAFFDQLDLLNECAGSVQ